MYLSSFQSDDEGSFILSSLLVHFIQKAVVSTVGSHCNSSDIEDSETVTVSNNNWNSSYWLGCNITFGAFKNQPCYLRIDSHLYNVPDRARLSGKGKSNCEEMT